MKRDSFPITEYVIGMEKFTATWLLFHPIYPTLSCHTWMIPEDFFLAWQAISPCWMAHKKKSLNLHPRNHRFMTKKKTFMCRYTPLILLLYYVHISSIVAKSSMAH